MNFQKYGFISLDHMTHIDNLDSIFKYGLLAHNNPYKKVDISNKDVNFRRKVKENIYGRSIHDYVPFYFNPRNAMMYKNRNEQVVILAFSKSLLYKNNTLFTDRNAATKNVRFYNNLQDLDKINWDIVTSQSWNGKPEDVKQIMMAEVLVYNKVPVKYFIGIYCKDEAMKQYLMQRYNLPSSKVFVKPDYFFSY
jgi:hypothetical protein